MTRTQNTRRETNALKAQKAPNHCSLAKWETMVEKFMQLNLQLPTELQEHRVPLSLTIMDCPCLRMCASTFSSTRPPSLLSRMLRLSWRRCAPLLRARERAQRVERQGAVHSLYDRRTAHASGSSGLFEV
eukprot:1187420-Pleurochrysis_carterae.AAC.2